MNNAQYLTEIYFKLFFDEGDVYMTEIFERTVR